MTKNVGVIFDDTDVSAKKTIASGPITVRAIAVASTDSAARIVELFFFDGEKEFVLAAVSIPSDSGTDGTAVSVDLLNVIDLPWVEVDAQGNNVIRLGEGESLRVGIAAALTAGKFVYVTAFGGDNDPRIL